MLSRALHFWRRVSRVPRGPLVLLYHRVAEIETDPWGLCVSPARFSEHLEVLRRYGPCVTLGEFARQLEAGRLSSRTVAITFDDGYADNLFEAKPLLEKYDTAATFFLAAELLNSSQEFWWDDLERILMSPGILPSELVLRIGEVEIKHEFADGAPFRPSERLRDRQWTYKDIPPTPRHALYLELWKLLKPLGHTDRQAVLTELRTWAGVMIRARPTHRPLSTDEAVILGSSANVEIGAHTLTHPTLPPQPLSVQHYEIEGSKTACEALAGRPVISFSYPFGDHTDVTRQVVKNAGYFVSCAIKAGTTKDRSDRYRLPRVPVENVCSEEFEKILWTH